MLLSSNSIEEFNFYYTRQNKILILFQTDLIQTAPAEEVEEEEEEEEELVENQ